MSRSVLIYGAGALGRGFVAPLLCRSGFDVSFVDVDAELIARLRRHGAYRVAVAGRDGYRCEDVPVAAAYRLGEEEGVVTDHDLVVSCAGARASLGVARRLSRARAVVTCEDERDAAGKLRTLSGNPCVYLGIADVVASTAPPGLLAWDPLTVVTDEGVLVTELGGGALPAAVRRLDGPGVDQAWACKVFLHDATRAIVAHLGAAAGAAYVHQAMAERAVEQVAMGALEELVVGVTATGKVGERFARAYAEAELVRLRNPRLYDPIARVVREPLAALTRDGGLVGAARLVVHAGFHPEHVLQGIRAALGPGQPRHAGPPFPALRRALGASEVLRIVAGLDHHDPMHRLVTGEE